jgi:hypothetical protein
MHDIKLNHKVSFASQALTQESPAKVFSLMAVALSSMAFLLVVSFTNASFEGTRESFPDPFSPENVVSVLDNTAGSYSKFVEVAFVEPFTSDLAMYKENLDWVIDQGDVAILKAVGLEKYALLDWSEHQPQVAGAFVSASSQ